MKEIPLTQGKVALVDDNDYEYLNQWKWCVSSTGYAVKIDYTYQGHNKYYRKLHLMHRMLMQAPAKLYVDHIDHNKLNNQRSNLRICTQSLNNANSIKRLNTSSIYKGVHWSKRKQKWVAYCNYQGRRDNLGYFLLEEQAAEAYNQAAPKYFGAFAKLNVINESHDHQKSSCYSFTGRGDKA